MTAQAARPRARRGRPALSACLYLGCFIFDEPGERERSGSFQLVVEATSPEDAVERCQRRLRKLRSTTTLFDDPATIYVQGIIKLAGSFRNGLVVNWESGDRPPPPDIRLTCMIPEQKDHEALDYSWSPRPKRRKNSKDGETMEPFLDFGGTSARLAIDHAKGNPIDSGPSALPSSSARASRASKERTRAEARARKERRATLTATLDEMRGSSVSSRARRRTPGK